MEVNTEALLLLAKERGWSTPDLARRLGVDYSYLYRVIKGEKKGGSKLFTGLYILCKEEGLDFGKLIFLNKTLHVDNTDVK
ncbi:MAG: helix-turn-helix domain-containing protein [Peptococcaceae bacterium]|nr:helix-turn-helix domain-containing protein [Peptococcaceae bacterium]